MFGIDCNKVQIVRIKLLTYLLAEHADEAVFPSPPTMGFVGKRNRPMQ